MSRFKTAVRIPIVTLFLYVALAYLLVPFAWREFLPMAEAAEVIPKLTHTYNRIPGDPLNIELVGTKKQVVEGMLKAGWYPADEITFYSAMQIVSAVILHRPYNKAPVSNLFLWNRKQDLAFERLEGGSPTKRHHVRFWQERASLNWYGAATYDYGIGFSHTTGQVTHHVDADIDKERSSLTADLIKADVVIHSYFLNGVGPTINGRNGGGDRYFTDGQIGWIELKAKLEGKLYGYFQ